MPQNESEMNKRRMVRLSNEAAGQLTRECLQTALIRLLAEQEMDKISITGGRRFQNCFLFQLQ